MNTTTGNNVISLADYRNNRSEKVRKNPPKKLPPPQNSPRQQLEALGYTIAEPFDEADESMLYAPDGNAIGNFLAWPVAITYVPGSSIPSSWSIAGELLETGEKLTPIDLTPSDFKNANWVVNKWGIEPELAPKACLHFKKMIRQLMPHAKHQYLCNHLGWQIIDGHPVFVHVDGAIGSKGIQTVVDTSDFDVRLEYYRLPSCCNDLAAASASFLKLLDIGKPNLTFPVTAIVLATPLATLMRKTGVPIDFVPYLVGKSQEGKSTVGTCCQAMFGDFNKQRLPASFRDTVASLEPSLATVHDMLTMIDDYHPVNSTETKMMDNFADALDRMIADGNSRKRTGKRQQQVEGVALCTGESRPHIGKSGLDRYLFINVYKQDLAYREKLLPLLDQAPVLREFMVAYIKWIGENWDGLQARVRSRFQAWLGHFSEQTGRIPESCAKLGVGFEIGMDFLLESGAIDKVQHRLFLEQCVMSLQDLHASQAAQNPTSLFLSTLSELLSLGSIKLCPSAKEFKDSPRLVGFIAGDKVYLHPDRSINAVNARLQKKRSFMALPEKRDLFKLMADDEYLTYDEVRQRHTRQHRTGPAKSSQKAEFMEIPLSSLQDFDFFASMDKTA